MRAFPAVLAVLASLLAASTAAAAKPTYLALGDSVTFGFVDLKANPAPDYSKPATFLGYPELFGQAARLKVVNAACPGETSASLVSASGLSNGCENAYRKNFPLHVRYSGTQLSFALKYLRKHPRTRVVSLMIGANDLFLCQRTTSDGCVSELEAALTRIQRNVRTVVSGIRRKARYRGRVVLVNYFSTDYNSSFANGVVGALNNAQRAGAKGLRVSVADGFGQWRRATTRFGGNACTAGLLTPLGQSCDVHPSYAGQSLLGLAVQRAARL
jgi:lysophospholipase L1-like esterase